MSVSTTTNRVQYNGDDSTTAFTFSFPLPSDDTTTLVVKLDSTTQTITTHYTVSATNNDYSSGGTVTMVTAPATGEVLTIVRDVADTQATDFQRGGEIDNETLEDTLDKLTMQYQELKETVDRCIKFPIEDSSALNTEMPVAATRASDGVLFDASGNAGSGGVSASVLSSFMQTVADDADAAAVMRTIMAEQSEVLHLEGAANQDETVRFASDASLLWDESEDRFILDKVLIARSGVQTVTSADATITDTSQRAVAVTTGGTDRTITLPTASANIGSPITVIVADDAAGDVIIDGEGAETINGVASFRLYGQYQYARMVSVGSSWILLNQLQLTLEIGDWDMDATQSVTIAHSLSDITGIRHMAVTIRNDADQAYYAGPTGPGAASPADPGVWGSVDTTNIQLFRFTGGVFDGVGFDSTSYNRGWVTLTYVPT
ncbi:MAG: hypothetical protein ACR2P5_07700 [Gammaproteobacteria bacterium]